MAQTVDINEIAVGNTTIGQMFAAVEAQLKDEPLGNGETLRIEIPMCLNLSTRNIEVVKQLLAELSGGHELHFGEAEVDTEIMYVGWDKAEVGISDVWVED